MQSKQQVMMSRGHEDNSSYIVHNLYLPSTFSSKANKPHTQSTSSPLRSLWNISLDHNHAHDGFREVMPETVLSQARMEHHGNREYALVDAGPPLPRGRAYLAIHRDGHGVPEITSKKARHEHSAVAHSARPHLLDHVRALLDTLQHELVAHPALVALRHVIHWDTTTTRLIYTVNKIKHRLFHNLHCK
jgi:hypothetical protein